MYYKDYSIDKYAKGGIFKDKLIGSSSNPEGILKLLKQFFYSPNIFLTEDEISDNYYVINNAKGVIKNYYVFFSKGRYRLYEKDKVDFDERIKEQREKSEILNKQNKLKNKNFVDIMADFLLNNKIKGTPTTYGFNINRTPDFKERLRESEDKLEKLGIKYQLDFSNQWNVMFKLSKKDFTNYKDDNKVTDETKTKDIKEVEITKDNNIDKLIKALQTSLKYAGANTRLKIEEQISALRIAQKYEKPSIIDSAEKKIEGGQNQDEIALNLLNKLKEEGKLKRYLDVRGNGKKVFDIIVPNKKEKGMYKRYESLSQTSIGTLQNEYLDETDVLRWLKKTMPKREMADGEMMAKGGKFKEYKPKFLKKGYDYGKKAYHNGINAAFYDTEFNSFLKENVYPKKDNKIVIDYLYSYNKGWNDENYKNTDWLVKGND